MRLKIVVYGLLLMFLMIVMPGGVTRALASAWSAIVDRMGRRRGRADDE